MRRRPAVVLALAAAVGVPPVAVHPTARVGTLAVVAVALAVLGAWPRLAVLQLPAASAAALAAAVPVVADDPHAGVGCLAVGVLAVGYLAAADLGTAPRTSHWPYAVGLTAVAGAGVGGLVLLAPRVAGAPPGWTAALGVAAVVGAAILLLWPFRTRG